MPATAPTLTSHRIRARPDRWRALGLTLDEAGRAEVGGIVIEIAADRAGEDGLRAWGWRDLPEGADLDGLVVDAEIQPAARAPHPLGVVAVDHVVVTTGDMDRTVAAFDAAGLDRRRIREAGEIRQAFYLAGSALVEVVGPAQADRAPARLWGLTFAVADLDAAAGSLGDLLGDVRDAVQPGRSIATATRRAGLGVPVALMTPRR
jgi:hypothetical protein